MSAMNAKGYMKCYKQRIKKKLLELISEVDNFTSLINGEVLKLKETVQAFQNNDKDDFLDVYHKTNEDLEKFSEKLFFINNVLDSDASGEACSPVPEPSKKKQVFEQSKTDECKHESPSYEVQKDHPECKTSSLDVCNQNAVLKSISELCIEQNDDTKQPEVSLFQSEETLDSSSNVSETSSINRDNVNSRFENENQTHHACNDVTMPVAEHVHKGVISQGPLSSVPSQSRASFCDHAVLPNTLLPEFDKQTPSPCPTSTLVDQCESMFQSAKNINSEQHTPENVLSNKEILKPQVNVGTYIHAKVTEFQSPSEFWLQLWKLDDTLSYLSKFKSYTKLQASAIKKDDYCLAPFEDSSLNSSGAVYQRARIMNTFGSGGCITVVIFFVDFGSTRLIDSSELRVMPESFFSHAARSIPCYLYGISPTDYKWSHEANQKFQEITAYDGQVFIVCMKDGKYGVDFKIPLPENQTCNLSDILCCFGFAKLNSEVHSSTTNSENNVNIDEDDQEYFMSDENIDLSCSKIVNDTSDNCVVSHSYENSEFVSVMTTQTSSGTESEYYDFSSNERCENTDRLSGNVSLVSHVTSSRIPNDFCESQCSNSYEVSAKEKKQIKLQEFDWRFVIPPPKPTYFKDDIMLVIPSAIYSPHEFYINPVCENSGPDFDSIQEKMNAFYCRVSNFKGFQINEENVKVGMFCCSQFKKDNCWYRAQVLEIHEDKQNKNQKTALVQYVDYGDNCYVPVDTLKPLTKEFAMFPAYAILCSLAFILPKLHDEESEWSRQSIETFKDILGFDKCYTAKVIGSQQLLDKRTTLDVFLWDSTDTGDRLINDVLIKEGLAVAVTDAAADFLAQKPNGRADSSDPMANWDPMSEDYVSIRNSYKVPTDDIGVVVDGYKRTDERFICKFFDANGKCPRPSCDFLHIRTGNDNVSRERDFLTLPLENDIVLPDPPSAVMGHISCVLTPAHFFLIFPFGTATVNELQYSSLNVEKCFAEYEVLEAHMTSFYHDAPFDEVTTISLSFGLIVAAKYGDLWLRARVTDSVDLDKEVQVFFVDTGVTAWVKRKCIRTIQNEYLFTRFQAVECLLSDIEPYDYQNGGKWSSQARSFFRKLLKDKILIVLIDKKNGSTIHGRLKLTAEDGAVMVNDLLVQAGFAQYMSTKIQKKGEVKLENTINAIPNDLPVPV